MGGTLSRGKAGKPPNLRDRLSDAFLQAFESDFAVHGLDTIIRLREKWPERYAELGAKLITQAEQPPDPTDFSTAKTQEEIARRLLAQVGISEDQLTPDMLERAAVANNEFVDKLLVIASGN
jgi:hypothetical protein